MKQKTPLCLFIIVLFMHSLAAQNNVASHKITINLPDVALISVQSTNTAITLSGNKTTEAGENMEFNTSDNSTWINYSSIVGSKNKPNRSVTVEISEGNIPEGLELTLNTSDYTGEGKGKLGDIINKEQTLSSSPVKIIQNIGSCYTGKGVNNGHNITYNLKLDKSNDAYSKLNYNQSQTISLTYTLTDN